MTGSGLRGWLGVYVGILIVVAWALHFQPLTAGLFVGGAYFAATALLLRGEQFKLVTLVSISLTVYVMLVWPAWKP
jgi:hypothetical protein